MPANQPQFDSESTAEDGRHCQRVVAMSARQAASGATFNVSISTLQEGERIEAVAGSDGEEVATILEGFFSVTVDDEFYRLTVGEGIIIPPGEPRLWVCESPRGVLYRALTR